MIGSQNHPHLCAGTSQTKLDAGLGAKKSARFGFDAPRLRGYNELISDYER